ncbi:GspH/FimT family protein [Chromobacterium sp. IIBBL 290-4]|uniref:GspH/FimT family pseudopilin n=1 Tax=Chromobacterium sp. IIBBL 290-4 TaxID=2953890 RepID=UPI0020B6DE9C|nr:GspH/FimT family protein [Chromobacterium sp. IIBBL 290-4]UTH74329.1 GspH/FimT family protein [Chromobacterium sp. IIBBL 290-4]
MDRTQGFTLMELLIVMALLAVVLALAVPSYRNTIAANNILSESNNLLGDLLLARNEAIKRGQVMLVCASSNGTGCNGASTATNFASGWVVMLAANNSCGDTTGTVLRRQAGFSSGDSASYGNTSNTSFCFNRLGYAPSANTGMVTFNTSSSLQASRRCLALGAVGHPQILSSGQTDASGLFSCP